MIKIEIVFFLFLLFGNLLASQTLTVGNVGDEIVFDPAAPFYGSSSLYNCNIYETLVNYDFKNKSVSPYLASEWQMLEKGKKWIFFLRRDVKFHDGSAFNADAVLFSFLRQMNRDHPYRFYDFVLFSEIFPDLVTVRKKNEFQVEFELKRPLPFFLKALTADCAAIVSPEAVKKSGPEFLKNPSGTGPYRLGRYQPGKDLELIAFEDYWGKKPVYKRIVFQFDRNFELQVENLKAGRTDLLLSYSISKTIGLRKISWLKVDVFPVYSVNFIVFNLEHPLFKKEALRRALVYLWDERILTQIFQSFVYPLHIIVPPEMLPEADFNHSRFSLEAARKELQNAGWKKGDRLEILLSEEGNCGLNFEMLRLYQRRAQQVGLDITFKFVSRADYDQLIRNRNYQLTVSGWIADYPDLENFIAGHFSADLLKKGHPNLSSSWQKDLLELFEQAKAKTDESQRRQLFLKIVRAVYDRALVLPLYIDSQVLIYNKKIGHIPPDPLQRIIFSKIER